MPFTWVYPANQGDYVQSEEAQEVRTNMNTLATNILTPTPASAQSIPFVQPLADGLVVQDEVGDEIQANLDILKSENYCRGHHNARHISNNASDRVAIHSLRCTDLGTNDNISDNATYRISLHLGYYAVNDTSKHVTYNGGQYISWDNSD